MNNEQRGWPGLQRGVTACAMHRRDSFLRCMRGDTSSSRLCKSQFITCTTQLLHKDYGVRQALLHAQRRRKRASALPPAVPPSLVPAIVAAIAAIAAITTVRRGPAGWAVAAVPGRGVVRRWLGVGAEGDWAIRVRRRAGLGGGGLGGGRPGRRRTGRGRLGGQRAGQRGLSWGLSWGLNAAVAWCMEGAEEAHACASAAGSLRVWK